MKTFAIIPSGGKGKRFGGSTPKQYLKAKGKEMIVYSLEIFQNSLLVDEIIVAAEEEYHKMIENVKIKYGISKLNKIVKGGKERQDSVFSALSSLQAKDDDLIVIHDAVRPLLQLKTLNNIIEFGREKKNAVTVITARDTLIQSDDENIVYLDRSKIYYVQTPQIFPFGTLKQAMVLAYKQNFWGTDESVLVNRAGYKVNFIEGEFLNFKITSKSDFEVFLRLC